jgi:hypothetical protein
MSDILRFLGLGAKMAESKYIVDIFKLKEAGCKEAGGKIILSSNADTCEIKDKNDKDAPSKYLYPIKITFGEKKEKQGGGRKKKNKTKKTKKSKKNKKSKTKKIKTTSK